MNVMMNQTILFPKYLQYPFNPPPPRSTIRSVCVNLCYLGGAAAQITQSEAYDLLCNKQPCPLARGTWLFRHD